MTAARQALRDAAARFAFSDTARLDAELLLAHALGITRERLLLTLDDWTAPPGYAAMVERRVRHEPVAYITGTRAFWTIELAVGPGALIPRPDSETLLEAALAHFTDRLPARVLDLGTGPGTLLLAALAEWPHATGLGVDRSDAALDQARTNAAALALADRAAFQRGDWAAGIAERFDLVLANPPYVAVGADLPDEVRDYEPAAALFAGIDGLDDYRVIAPQLPALLAPGGLACVEIGADQGATVTALFRAAGLGVALRRDLAGRDRCLVVTA
ncbi:peptide chain release factor N(5)-glutamine methyltransferase [Sphingomonas yunnanensis]|uniref:peptide chain release factor N(5)-glutamine methyltransferase n=1 Tax=Sphingomonas yunnanensis TaxID=310400 RepID=UPI001CA77B23|nr:peptide chain release factor N(5)-glutamine methyltransferase [Sphingomonas yunnanensis]MBY9065131.1 peptide chain release factor N(5)-glutamine methyltransferase [Sphingomonas yunnanensis]